MAVKDRIVARRKQLRWEAKEAAHHIDIGYQYLWKLEQGKNVPPAWGLLVKLASGLQTSVDYILELTDDPTPAARRAEWTPEAIAAAQLINTAPPEKREGALAVLKAAVELTQVSQKLEPAAAPANVGGGVTLTGQQEPQPQNELPAEKDALLSLLQKVLSPKDYEYVVQSVERGQPLTDAELAHLIQASGHNAFPKDAERLNNTNLVN